MLNILAGLDAPSDGTIIVDHEAIEGPSLDRAVIFQGHALLPWRTVMGNVAYAVSSRRRVWGTWSVVMPGSVLRRTRRAQCIVWTLEVQVLDFRTTGRDTVTLVDRLMIRTVLACGPF